MRMIIGLAVAASVAAMASIALAQPTPALRLPNRRVTTPPVVMGQPPAIATSPAVAPTASQPPWHDGFACVAVESAGPGGSRSFQAQSPGETRFYNIYSEGSSVLVGLPGESPSNVPQGGAVVMFDLLRQAWVSGRQVSLGINSQNQVLSVQVRASQAC